jgi:hypothetical protein
MLHSVRETGRRIRHHAGRAIRTASNVTAAITPGYQKFIHPCSTRSRDAPIRPRESITRWPSTRRRATSVRPTKYSVGTKDKCRRPRRCPRCRGSRGGARGGRGSAAEVRAAEAAAGAVRCKDPNAPPKPRKQAVVQEVQEEEPAGVREPPAIPSTTSSTSSSSGRSRSTGRRARSTSRC